MGPAQDRDFILRQGEKCSTLYKFYTEKENQMKTASGDAHSRSGCVSFNETHRRGSSQAGCSCEGSERHSLPRRQSGGLPQGRLSLPQQPSKKEQVQGANSRGNLKVRGEPW